MRSWIVAQISDPSISPRRRQARLEVLISALDICRSRSADPDTVWTPSPPSFLNGFHVEPRIATFVGSAIRSAILSPESRAFAHSWHAVALVRGKSSIEGLAGLLSEMEGSTPLDCTVDLGWFLERLVEVVCVVPEFVDSSMQVSSLVNFDKRRFVFSFLRLVPSPFDLADLLLISLLQIRLQPRRKRLRHDLYSPRSRS